MANIKDAFKMDKKNEHELRERVLKLIREGYLPIQPMARQMGMTGATLTAFLCNSRGVDYRTLLRIEDWVKAKEKKEKNGKP